MPEQTLVFLKADMYKAQGEDSDHNKSTDHESSSSPAKNVSEMQMEMEEWIASYCAMVNSGDVVAVSNCWAADATMMRPGCDPVHGREAIYKTISALMRDLTLKMEIEECDDCLGCCLKGSMSWSDKNGKKVLSGRFLYIMTKVDGMWLIQTGTTNVSDPKKIPVEQYVHLMNNACMMNFSKGEFHKIAATFTQEGTIAFPNMPTCKGHKEIQAMFEAVAGMGGARLEKTATSVKSCCWTACELGKVKVSLYDGSVFFQGNYQAIWKEQADGTWKRHWCLATEGPAEAK